MNVTKSGNIHVKIDEICIKVINLVTFMYG